MPEYSEVKWDQAECRGTIYTELFYLIEEQRSLMQYEYINALRSICARCPIWSSCLSYALEHESYGVWGGMTSIERVALQQIGKYPNQRARAIRDLAKYGITLEQILECM